MSASLDHVKLSANWMAAAGHRGEDAQLFETVEGGRPRILPGSSACRFRSARIRCRMSTALGRRRRQEAGRRAAVADRHRLRGGRRRAPHADAATGARRRRRNRTDADRPRRRQQRLGGSALAQVYELGRRVRAGCRCRSAQGLLRRDPAAESRRPAARLPRPLRRRPVRDDLRDGLRLALRRLADDRHASATTR